MAYALCFTSALEYWNAHANSPHSPSRTPSACRRATASFASSPVEKPSRNDVDVCRALLGNRPIHIAVTNPKARIERPEFICHSFSSSLPPEGVSKIAQGVYASTPEFAFVQLGTRVPFAQLVQIGFEICGSYCINDRGTRTDRPPLSTAKKLRDFAQSTSFPGCASAARAAQYVIDGSASPRETQLAMLLSLPMKYGGYGLPRPQLNYRIQLASKAGIIGKDTLICDLFWPDARLAVEYDSDEFHAMPLAISRDSQRRLALEVQGITCVNVANMRLANFAAFDETALGIARLLGKRIRRDKRSFIAKNRTLREAIGISTANFDQDMYSQ